MLARKEPFVNVVPEACEEDVEEQAFHTGSRIFRLRGG
jgi:hypothetical protein